MTINDQLGDIYENFYQKIYFTCFKIVKDENLAKDIASDSFIKLCKKVSSGAEIDSLSSFWWKIAKNEALNSVSANKNRSRILGSLYDRSSSSLQPSAEQNIMYEQVMTLLSKRFSNRQMEIFRLISEGNTQKEVAEQFGDTPKNIHRSYKKMMGILGQLLQLHLILSFFTLL